MRRALTSLVSSALAVLSPGVARAAPQAGPAGAPRGPAPTDAAAEEAVAEGVAEAVAEAVIDQKLAVWRFDALGIEAELVGRLETLFRMELDRLDKHPMPTRRDIDRAITGELRDCTGEDRCLAAIGKKLGVEIVLAGTVGQLGDTYVLTIKAVDVATARTVQKIQSDPLRGQPDELIEGVRVAAYRLLAPSQLHGAIQLQTDLIGAEVALDGAVVGKTPLPGNGVLGKLALGKHRLRVSAPGYEHPYDEELEVHFQKVSPVVVRLVPSTQVIAPGPAVRVSPAPFYTRTWFLVAVGVAAIGVGAAIGYSVGHIETCRYGADGKASGC